MFNDYLELWRLTPDGEPIATPTSRLLPVRSGNASAMLKIAIHDEEKRGNLLMSWWNGRGAAPVLAQADNAILMVRADEENSLSKIIRGGDDDEASGIICAVLEKLHAPPNVPLPSLPLLTDWFQSLDRAKAHGGIFAIASSVASTLLRNQREIAVLHGDIHHGNILHFGSSGWLAIDPKGLIGEKYFDYANIFCNPDHDTAISPGRLERQIEVVCEAAKLEPRRLVAWVVAWAGLSAAFCIEDGQSPDGALKVAELAAARL